VQGFSISLLWCDDRQVPELPEVETVRRELAPVLEGARFVHVTLRRENLRRPFPPDFAARLEKRTVRALTRRGKYLLAALSSGETLLMHLGMSGSFRIELDAGASGEAGRHDHVIFRMSSGAIVTFNDPRRFGVMDLIGKGELDRFPALAALGPEPLGPDFNAGALARAVAGKRTPLKVALLDQRVVAGLGNIYASEALHRAGLSPRRHASTIATPGGLPRPGAVQLAKAIKQVLQEAIARRATAYRSSRFRVYDRAGEPCRTRSCEGTIRRFSQAGRSTFSCTICQS
jgi:formamidopyrimidine-DNA glycosylase